MWSLVLALLAGYQLLLPARFEVAAGTTGAVSMTVAPQPGHVVSRAGPLRISLRVRPDDGGLILPRRRYQRDDAADQLADSPRFDLAVKGQTPGTYQLDVTARFWICRKRTCRPVTDHRTVEIEVTGPGGSAPAGPGPGPDAGARSGSPGGSTGAPPVTRTR